MKDGVCKASMEKIARRIGVDRTTAHRHIKALCEAGYLKDLTPGLRNCPHTYADTGRAKIRLLAVNVTIAHSEH
jgi:DNA-binding MarR family transcriptional regulator